MPENRSRAANDRPRITLRDKDRGALSRWKVRAAHAHLFHRRSERHPRDAVVRLYRVTRGAAHRHRSVHILTFLNVAMALQAVSRRRVRVQWHRMLAGRCVGLGSCASGRHRLCESGRSKRRHQQCDDLVVCSQSCCDDDHGSKAQPVLLSLLSLRSSQPRHRQVRSDPRTQSCESYIHPIACIADHGESRQ